MVTLTRMGAAVCLLAVGAALAQPRLAGAEETIGATVNGVAIPERAFIAEYNWNYNQKSIFHTVPEERKAAMMKEAVDVVVAWELVEQNLAAEGKSATAAEVDDAVKERREKLAGQFPGYLKALGQDDASFRYRTKGIINFKRWLALRLRPQVVVSERDVREAYDQRSNEFNRPVTYEAEGLQIFSYDKTGRLMHRDLGGVAAAAAKLAGEGKSFEEAAKAATSAEVGTRVTGERCVAGQNPICETALAVLKAGELSPPLKVTENSYMIYRLVKRHEAVARSFDEVREEIRESLLQRGEQGLIAANVAALKAAAKIEYNEKALRVPAAAASHAPESQQQQREH